MENFTHLQTDEQFFMLFGETKTLSDVIIMNFRNVGFLTGIIAKIVGF